MKVLFFRNYFLITFELFAFYTKNKEKRNKCFFEIAHEMVKVNSRNDLLS